MKPRSYCMINDFWVHSSIYSEEMLSSASGWKILKNETQKTQMKKKKGPFKIS